MLRSVWRKVIGWSQVLGGAAGYALLGFTAVQQPRLGIPAELRLPVAWYLMGAAAFTGAIAAGALLLRGHRAGPSASALVQAAQLVQLSLPSTFVYQFATGIQVLLVVSPTAVRLSPGVNASFTALRPRAVEPWSVGLNLFALFALVVLLRAQRHEPAEASSATATGLASG